MLKTPKTGFATGAAAGLAGLLASPLVPVFYHADAAYACQLLGACYAGGIRAVEFTNRGANALAVFARLRQFSRAHCPGLLLGIGTIFTAAEAEAFIRAGADFVVQPVTGAEVAAACRRHDRAWVPGALTPGEIYHAAQLGAGLVKVFPGNAVGPDYIRALRGPLPQVRLMVTGGVAPTPESLGAWFGAGASCVGLGAQLFAEGADLAALPARLAALLAFVETLKP